MLLTQEEGREETARTRGGRHAIPGCFNCCFHKQSFSEILAAQSFFSLWNNCSFALYSLKQFHIYSGTAVTQSCCGKILHKFVTQKVQRHFALYFECIILVFLKYESKYYEQAYLINLLLILGKFHIHRCKFSNQKTTFTVFYRQFELYLRSIASSENKKV